MRVSTAIVFVAAALLSLGAAPRARAAELDDLYRALEPHLLIDTQRVNEAAIAAALAAIDPHAMLAPKGEESPPAPQPTLAVAERWPEAIVYVKFNGVHGAGRTETVAAIRALLDPAAIGLILDLRGAGGEDLDTLDALAGLFFAADAVIYELRNGYASVLAQHAARATTPPPALPPVMLLVDRDTHGASEALAAILRNHSGVMLLGAATRGDSAQRTRVPWTDTLDLWVGTAWLVPTGGEDYYPAGVQPHVPVPAWIPPVTTNATPAATAAAGAAPMTDLKTATTNAPVQVDTEPSLAQRVGTDPVLRRATDMILGLHALRQP